MRQLLLLLGLLFTYNYTHPQNLSPSGHHLLLQTTQNTYSIHHLLTPWNLTFRSTSFPLFVQDFLVSTTSDTLTIIDLNKEKATYLTGIRGFKAGGSAELLVIKNDNTHSIVNLQTGTEYEIQSGQGLDFPGGKNILILQQDNSLRLQDNKNLQIWKGETPKNIIIDKKQQQLTFTVNNDLWAYAPGIATAKLVCHDWTDKAVVQYLEQPGYAIYTRKSSTTNSTTNPQIWSYANPQTVPSYLNNISNTGVINLYTGTETDLGEGNSFILRTMRDTLLSWKKDNDGLKFTITALTTGKKQVIDDPAIAAGAIAKRGISPDGKWLVFFRDNACYSYHIGSGTITLISQQIPTSLLGIYRDDINNTARGVAGWNAAGTRVYVYDTYDLWSVDPEGKSAPVNLTNGYGARHHVLFHVQDFQGVSPQRVIQFPLILNTFQLENKQNGFFRIKNEQGHDPELLTMGDVQYDIMNNPYVPDGSNFMPLKAKDAEVYIVRRQTAIQPPNFFLTKDFKSFRQLTFTPPDSNYTASLHPFTSLDGQQRQGILYKPWDFDSSRKYPIIVHIYERKSDGCNSYLPVQTLNNGCNINIPTYTRQGYLVFTPDIYYQPGNPMQGTYDAVIGAAEYLEKLPYVDAKHMGIQGCSWGAIQINYLVTHSDKFAAACSASGVADWMMAYNSILWNGMAKQDEFESGQFRMKATPWDIPEQYIHSSPIYAANHMNTPLLLMHTTNDGTCPFNNILSFFLALRRLHKPGWLLQYNDGNHGLFGPSAVDFSTRMMQFFNYYLKGTPRPEWLVEPTHKPLLDVNDH